MPFERMEVAVSCMEVSTARLRCCPCCPCRVSLGEFFSSFSVFGPFQSRALLRLCAVIDQFRHVWVSQRRYLQGVLWKGSSSSDDSHLPACWRGGATTRSLAHSLTRWPFSGWAKPEAFSERPGRQEQERPQGRPQGRLPPGVCGGRSFDVHAVPHQVRALLVDHRCLRSELVGRSSSVAGARRSELVGRSSSVAGAPSRRSEPPSGTPPPPPPPPPRSLVFVRSRS